MRATLVSLIVGFLLAVAVTADAQLAAPVAEARPQLSHSDAKALVERFEPVLHAETLKRAPVGELVLQVLQPSGTAEALDTPIGDAVLRGPLSAPVTAVTPNRVREKGPRKKKGSVPDQGNTLPADTIELLTPDWAFSAARYDITYRQRDRVGAIDALVYDVEARDRNGFSGRIWLSDRGTLLRYRGSRQTVDALLSRVMGRKTPGRFVYAGWRTAVDGGLFTTDVFVQETPAPDHPGMPLARGRLLVWNYAKTDSSRGSVTVTAETTSGPPALERAISTSPEENERRWEREVEDYVLDVLEGIHELAPEGSFETSVCGQIITNLLAPAALLRQIDPPVRCRVLTTSRLVVQPVGHTIAISIGMLDAAGDEGTLAMATSHALGHMALDHRLIDPKIALADLAPAELLKALEPKPFKEEEADSKALELLTKSLYAGSLEKAGLFLDAVNDMAPRLPGLMGRNFLEHVGDQGQTLRWSAEMQSRPIYDPARDGHFSALPLGSRVVLDRKSNRVELLGAAVTTVRGKSFGLVPPYPADGGDEQVPAGSR